MTRALIFGVSALLLFTLPVHADVRAKEVVKTYSISGKTGLELYSPR